MKKKGKLWLAVIILVLAAILFVFTFGLTFGIKEFKPLVEQFKDRKMSMDLDKGTYVIFKPEGDAEVTDDEVNKTVNVIRSRLASLGYADSQVSKLGEDKVYLTVSVKDSIASAIIEFLRVPSKVEIKDPDGKVIITNDDIASAKYEVLDNEYVVAIKMTQEGSKKYSDATSNLVNSKVSIYIDEQLAKTKTIKDVVQNGEEYFSDSYSAAEAIEVAAQINSGSVPYKLEVDEASVLSAVNGYKSFRQIATAGLIAAALVIAALIILYRIPGVMTSISLLYYLAIAAFCILTIPNVRLNIPGIFGFVVATAVFIDINIIILNRLKEEIMAGKTHETSLQLSFSKTSGAVICSNFAIIVFAFGIMFTMGQNYVDFAYVLGICTAVSYFVTYIISRALIKQVLRIGIKNAGLYLGIKGEHK